MFICNIEPTIRNYLYKVSSNYVYKQEGFLQQSSIMAHFQRVQMSKSSTIQMNV